MNALTWLTAQQYTVHAVEPLAGLTACSRLITLKNGDKLVWREQSQRATDYGINYQQEAALLNTLAFLPFIPKPRYSCPQFTLLHWLEGETPTHYHDTLLQKLATALATLHTVDWQAVANAEKLAKLRLDERCQFLWEQLSEMQQATLPFSPPFPQIEPFTYAICHHDLHLGNLVERGEQLFLIDWEYSAISDPALELALCFSANSLTERQQAVFLSAYFAKSGFDRTACLAKMREYQPVVEQLNQLWFMINKRGTPNCKEL